MPTRDKEKFVLIVLGDPASGKNTQVKFLQKKYKAKVFSSGDALRLLEKTNSEYKNILSKTLDKGGFVPAKIYEKIFTDFLKTIPKNTNIILNGNPRMSTEAAFVLKKLGSLGRKKIFAIYLKIPKAEIIKRTAKRKNTEHRKDDAFVLHRIQEHKKHTAALLQYFKNRSIWTKRIDGTGDIPSVQEKIMKGVGKLLEPKD